MAIVKMKKLQLIICRSDKDAFLSDVQRLGTVEFRNINEISENEEISGSFGKLITESSELRAKKAMFSEALKLLDKYAPVKKPLLSAKPLVKEDEFLSDKGLDEAEQYCRRLIELESQITEVSQRCEKLSYAKAALKPWEDFELPVETAGTEHVAFCMGSIPSVVDFNEFSRELSEKAGPCETEEIGSDEHTRYLSCFYLKEKDAEAQDVFKSFGFTLAPVAGMKGTPKENLKNIQKEIIDLEVKRSGMEREAALIGENREQIKLCCDRIGVKEEREEAQDKFLSHGSIVCMEGWSAETGEEELIKILQKYDCAYDLLEIPKEEYDEVPVSLKNNKFTNGLNMVTNMYSLPKYGTVDPNPLIAPFFILFYGLMMADMGYGLIMLAAGLVAQKKIRPHGTMLHMSQLLVWGGISTFIMGALTGGFFADLPLQVAKLINPDTTWTGLPCLFSPLDDALYVLVGAIGLGLIQLNVGMIISFVQKVKNGETLSAALYEGSLWVVLIGIVVYALAAFVGVGSTTVGLVILIVGLVILFGGSMVGKKGFGMITAIFGTLYNEATGWFGDLLSYSRIMALMLAGSVVGQVFNTIGALFGPIVFIIVAIIGHALNFALNLLGCYVHDLRLQCLEYFGKFYVDGGKPFNPLNIKTNYVDVTK